MFFAYFCGASAKHHTRTKPLKEMKNFIERFETSVKENWDNAALSDYRGETWSYSQVAHEIATMHLVWKAAGITEGDKISLNARSCANWAKMFLAATTGGQVAVQLFNGFTPAEAETNFKAVMRIKREVDGELLFLANGDCCYALRQMGTTLGVCMWLCVQNYRSDTSKEQPLLRAMKQVKDNFLFV